MTDLQRLILRGGEIRTRLNELGSLPELTDEQRTEIGTLRNEYGDVERRTAALTIAGDGDPGTGTGEIRERADLETRASLGGIFASTLEHRTTEGAEAELQTELGLNANQVPLAMLRGLRTETRAVTPAPGNVGQTQAEIIPYVFPQACAAFLGVEQPTVGVGEAVFPVLTAKTGVHTPAENAAAAETTGSFAAEVLSPSRLQASFFYSREDRARFRGMDSSLRMNLSDALSDGLDAEVIAGTDGLLTSTNLANHNVTAVTTYALYRSQFGYGRVDGRYASGVGDVRIVMGSGTYGHASGVFRSNDAGDRAALEDLMSVTGGVKVSAHVPAPTGTNRQNNIIRLGSARDMVAPIWEGVTLIPDEVTKAGVGQIVITAVMLHAVKILRAAGFYKQMAQVA